MGGDASPDWDQMIAALNDISESCGIAYAGK